jgi:PKD repeat protein
VYQNTGDYTVSLTVTGPNGSDTETKTDYISVFGVPAADFSGTPDSGSAPLTVTFTDLSSGNPSDWTWDFGDGGTSYDQNPAYTYDSPGLFTVTLTASNACGSDTEVKTDYIMVTEEVVRQMHVADILVERMTTQLAGRTKWYAVAEVTVEDQYNQPVADATVSGFFNKPYTKTEEGTTDGSGVAVITSKDTPKPPSDWCFEVTDVAHANHSYDPASNLVTKACESGWVYRVSSAATHPDDFGLGQNYPNPFNPMTEISFKLPEAADVEVDIYNLLGQHVATLASGVFQAGEHTLTWNGKDSNGRPVSSGIYLYRLEAGHLVDTKKMVLLK